MRFKWPLALRRSVEEAENQADTERTKSRILFEAMQEQNALIGDLQRVESGEIKFDDNNLTGRFKGDWVRIIAYCAAELFRKSNGTNFVEWTFNTDFEAFPGMGPLSIRVQRRNGLTPAEALSDIKRFWHRRISNTISPEMVCGGVDYLVLLDPADAEDLPTRWRIMCGFDNGYEKLLVPMGGPLVKATDAFEIYELRYPDEPDPERLPRDGMRVVFLCDMTLPKDEPRGKTSEVFVKKDTVGTLERRMVDNMPRFFVRPKEYHTDDADAWYNATFPDDGSEMPEHLGRAES